MKRLLTLAFILIPSLAKATPVPLLAHSHVNGTVVPSTTVYIVPGNTVVAEFPTETWAQIPFYSSGTFSGMYVRLEDNSITNPSTFTIRINGVNGNETVSLASGVKIGTDTIHTDHINYGDKIDIRLQTGSGGTTMQPLAVLFIFTPDTNINYQRMSPAAPNTGLSITNGFQPYYSNITGILGQNFFENHTYHVMRTSGTFKNLAVYVTSNTRTETIPYTLRKNGVSTALSTGVPAGMTGLFQQTTTEISVVIGDTVTLELGMNNGSDSNPIAISYLSMEYISSGTASEYAVGTDDKPQNAGETWTIPFISALTFGGDEYLVQSQAGGTLSKFCMYTAQNNVSTTSTLKFRKNGVTDASMVMTIPANSTGTFCDNTHSITFTSTDTLAYIGNSPAGTGTLYYSSIGSSFSPSSTTGRPVISPSSATVFVNNSILFTSTNSAVTWSLASGSTGTITSTGLYTAPRSIQAKNVIAGCPVVPNDHIYNVDITSLPVDANSATRMANVGAGIAINFEVSFPLNVMTNATPTQTMKFNYTTSNDGKQYPIISDYTRGVETNLYPNNYFAQDRHQLGVNTDSCQFTEIYNYYPIGTNTVNPCPTCNAQSGVQWGPMSYQLANSDGSTDAAGLYIEPLALRYSELKAGHVDHALRFTLSNGFNYSGFLWPGTNFAANCGTLATCFPYGSRLRLKASFSEAGFSPPALAIVRALKKYGMFMADGGINFHIQTMSDVVADTTTWTALMSEIPGSALDSGDFEQVDESSLMVSTATGRVAIPNASTTVPSNYAIVIASNTLDNTTSYVYVAIQPVTVGTKNTPFPPNSGTLSVMAGTPQFQIPYWVNGATTTTVTCSMSPTIGSLTSDCLYTAPTGNVTAASTTIVTISPIADSTAAINFPLTIVSSDGIRIDAGGKAGTITNPVIPYVGQNYGPDINGKLWAADPTGFLPPWYAHDDNSSPQASWPSTTTVPDVGLWYTDVHATSDGAYAAMVPNGNYILSMDFAWNSDPSIFFESIESQGSTIVSSATFASTIGTTSYNPITITSTITVTNNQFYFAMRYPTTSKFSLINAWSLIPSTAPAVSSSGRPFRGGGFFKWKGILR